MVYYLILHNEGIIVVCMKARNILSKCFHSNWVAVNFGCIGTLLILSVDYQFGAPLHTAPTVADTEGVGARMLQLHTHKCQRSILPHLSRVVILHLLPIEEPCDSGGGAASNLHCQSDLLPLQRHPLLLVIHNGWWGSCVCWQINNTACLVNTLCKGYKCRNKLSRSDRALDMNCKN